MDFRRIAQSTVAFAVLLSIAGSTSQITSAQTSENASKKDKSKPRPQAAAVPAVATTFPCNTPGVPCTTVGPAGRPQGWIVGEIRAFAFGADSKQTIDEMAVRGWVECAGETAVRTDFDELWRVIGTNWGSLSKFEFYLPDLRGMFIRGWNHSRTAPKNYPMPPYTGDLDLGMRKFPRPEAADITDGIAGPTDPSTKKVIADHVGSVQPDAVISHTHSFGYQKYDDKFQLAYAPSAAFPGSGRPDTNTTGNPNAIDSHPDGAGNETQPSNAYIMYFIYVGKPAAIIEPTKEEMLKDPGKTGKIVCKNKDCKPKVELED